ncbi:MAG TPA: MBL fold metallo-hydrolase [Gemmatimonadaceae bacterium]|nr:MBL fold metallo-hydrolase [Gemmatimonadaceae bacterium]
MRDRTLATALLPALAVLAASHAGAQQRTAADPLVPADTIVQVGAHTWVIPDRDVGLVPNVGIVVGTSATLVIDPGLGRRNGETVLRQVRRLSPGNAIYVASTHFHTEHTTGFLAFPEEARYVGSTIQLEEFRQGGAQQIRSFSGRSPLTAELLRDATVFEADITFDREHRLDLGAVRVRLVVVGPTHTRGDTGFLIEEDGVLFTGDVVMNQSFLAARAESSMRAWLRAFDIFEAMRPRVIVPAHGKIGDGSLIAANRAVMTTIDTRVRALKAGGMSLEDIVRTVQTELQARHPGWPRANGIPAAVRTAYAESSGTTGGGGDAGP